MLLPSELEKDKKVSVRLLNGDAIVGTILDFSDNSVMIVPDNLDSKGFNQKYWRIDIPVSSILYIGERK